MEPIGVFLGIGLMVAIIKIASAYANRVQIGHPLGGVSRAKAEQSTKAAADKGSSISSADKQRALDVYKELVKEKLDVIKTAIAMGYEERELKELDDRLERLIGKEQLARIAEGQNVIIPSELQQTSLEAERLKLQEMRQRATS